MNEIAHFLSIDLSEQTEKIINNKSLDRGHKIGGNGVRMKEKIVFDKKVGTSKSLPRIYTIISIIINWPFLLMNGYSVNVFKSR